MITNRHIPFSRSKRFNIPKDHILKQYYKKGQDQVSLLSKQTGEKDLYNQSPGKKLFDLPKKHLLQFKEWRMPEQSAGYIKAKKHGLL